MEPVSWKNYLKLTVAIIGILGSLLVLASALLNQNRLDKIQQFIKDVSRYLKEKGKIEVSEITQTENYLHANAILSILFSMFVVFRYIESSLFHIEGIQHKTNESAIRSWTVDILEKTEVLWQSSLFQALSSVVIFLIYYFVPTFFRGESDKEDGIISKQWYKNIPNAIGIVFIYFLAIESLKNSSILGNEALYYWIEWLIPFLVCYCFIAFPLLLYHSAPLLPLVLTSIILYIILWPIFKVLNWLINIIHKIQSNPTKAWSILLAILNLIVALGGLIDFL